MSEAGDRTEDATPRRREDARRKGQVAKSTDLVAAACLSVAGIALLSMVDRLPSGPLAFAQRIWSTAGDGRSHEIEGGGARCLQTTETLGSASALMEALFTAMQVVYPVALISAAAGVLATLAQVGVVFAPSSLKPDIKKLSPLAGAKRLFSPSRLMVIARAAVALLLTVTIVYAQSHPRARDILSMPSGAPRDVAALLGSLLPSLFATCGLALLLPGALDFVMARRRLSKDLRMSRREVRDEHKQNEGDPALKGRRKREHRDLSSSPSRPLKEAKVLVVNPTRLAVALHHGADLPVPEVGARGRGENAALMRAEARALGIPIMRDVPLARALIALEPGSSVPEPLFEAVAALLAAVYRAELSRG